MIILFIIIMWGFFCINTEIFLCLQVLYLLTISVAINEKILKLKYRFNIIKWVCNFSCLVLIYSLFVLIKSHLYAANILNFQINTDNFTFFFKIVIITLTIFCIGLAIDYNFFEDIKTYEYVLLLLMSVVGIFGIISSHDFIPMYLTIELQSLCFYVLTNIKFRSNLANEGGLKYFLLGAISSCVFLYGISFIYYGTGTTNFGELKLLLSPAAEICLTNSEDDYFFVLLGTILLYSGLLFKLGVVPFHMWVADVYEGAPTNIALFFAVVPYSSIICLLINLNFIFWYAFINYLNIFFIVLSILTITIGTLGAIYQTKLKRLFAYSSISNIGYLLCLFCSWDIETVFAIIFYILVYNIISFSLWLMLLTFRNRSNNGKLKDIKDLVLLFNSNKYLSFFFVVFLFSGMGIPPMLGFFSKLYIFLNIIELKLYFFMFYIIFINSIGAIYYLRLIKIMFFFKSTKYLFLEDPGLWRTYVIVLLAFINLFFFLYPTYLAIIIHNIVLLFFI